MLTNLRLATIFAAVCFFCIGFARKPKSESQHILLYGDAGDGGDEQLRVGRAMWQRHKERPFDFAVSMGDNLYLPYEEDIFRRVFEIPYAPLIRAGIKFYQTVGNHDLEDGRLQHELEYSRKVGAEKRRKGGWVLPAENYVIERENLTWIVLNVATADNSINIPDDVFRFALKHLCKKSDNWKIVSFHYPFWSSGMRGDNYEFQAAMLPILERCLPDFIFAGHEHSGQVTLPWKWTNHIVVGNAHEVSPYHRPSDRETLYFMDEIGFAELFLTADVADFRFRNAKNEQVYWSQIQKRVPLWADVYRTTSNSILGRVKSEMRGVRASDLEAQAGFSKSRVSPFDEPNAWTFVTANLRANGELDVFEAPLPEGNEFEFALFRFRIKGTERWIYGDASGSEGLHGNYDGIQLNNFLELR